MSTSWQEALSRLLFAEREYSRLWTLYSTRSNGGDYGNAVNDADARRGEARKAFDALLCPASVSQPLASEGPETPRKATPLAYDLVLAQSQAAREVEAGTVAVEALSAAETAVLDYIASLGDAEVSELRKACHRLAEALAKRCLDDANRDREAPRDWPAGQTWDQLVGSSHSIMRHRAWTEAGLGVDAMRALLFDEYGSPKPYAGDEDE